MQTPKKPSKRGTILYRTAALGVALGLVGCGGQVQFAGKTAMPIAGELPPPPPPPPPPPEPKPEPPKPPPRVEIKGNQIEIHEKVQFEHDKATIKEVSFGLLDDVVKVIKENAHIKKIQIEGHASAEGNANHNLKLSDSRAKAVKKYLVDHGIADAALLAKGFGKSRPLIEEKTEEDREKNRRVEFNIVEQDVTKKKVEIDPTTGKERVLEETKQTVTKPTEEVAPAVDAKDAKKTDAKADTKKADTKKPEAKADPKASVKADPKAAATTKAAAPKTPAAEPKKAADTKAPTTKAPTTPAAK